MLTTILVNVLGPGAAGLPLVLRFWHRAWYLRLLVGYGTLYRPLSRIRGCSPLGYSSPLLSNTGSGAALTEPVLYIFKFFLPRRVLWVLWVLASGRYAPIAGARTRWHMSACVRMGGSGGRCAEYAELRNRRVQPVSTRRNYTSVAHVSNRVVG